MKRLILAIVLSLMVFLVGCSRNEVPVSEGTMRLEIQSLRIDDSGRFIAQVQGLDNGGRFEVDITDASVDSDVERPVGAILYYSDPDKNNNDPRLYLRIKSK